METVFADAAGAMRFNLTGNAVSLVAACFTFASAWSTDRKRIYLYQAVQCVLLAVANIFFLSLSGVTTYLFCAARNLLLSYNRFTKKLCIVFVICVSAIGLFANNRGVIGLIPIITTVMYTVICLYAERTAAIKGNITTNLTLWAIYDILIADYVSFAVDTGSAITAFASIIDMNRENRVSGAVSKRTNRLFHDEIQQDTTRQKETPDQK